MKDLIIVLDDTTQSVFDTIFGLPFNKLDEGLGRNMFLASLISADNNYDAESINNNIEILNKFLIWLNLDEARERLSNEDIFNLEDFCNKSLNTLKGELEYYKCSVEGVKND